MSEISKSFDKASTADVFVAMLLGWKVYGHADISWWLVFAPWLVSIVIAAVLFMVVGIIKVIDH